jgi:hypothetical protein
VPQQINPQTGNPEPLPQTPEESFRATLDDVILVIQKLAPLSTDLDSLVETLQFALKNDSQLNMILHLVRPVGLKR